MASHYRLSNEKHWCEHCRCWTQRDALSIKHHESGSRHKEALRTFLGDMPARLNLIDVNDARPGGYRRATDTERDAFLDALQVLRAPIVRRFSVGREEHAACGMLAARLEGAV